MSETTKISWADSTASPWGGCRNRSAGCLNCYIPETPALRFQGYKLGDPRIRFTGFEALARKLNRKPWVCNYCGNRFASVAHMAKDINPGCAACGSPSHRLRIFPSLMDWLDEEVPIEWLADLLKTVHETPDLDWLLLTKRPELFDSQMLRVYFCHTHIGQEARELANQWRIQSMIPRNVWFGVTVEDNAHRNRIDEMLKIDARVHWVSAEPLLEYVDFKPDQLFLKSKVDWVVVGGESGKQRRDCGVDAIVDIANQCQAAGVPVFVKQDCAQKPGQQGRIPPHIWSLKQFPTVHP